MAATKKSAYGSKIGNQNTQIANAGRAKVADGSQPTPKELEALEVVMQRNANAAIHYNVYGVPAQNYKPI